MNNSYGLFNLKHVQEVHLFLIKSNTSLQVNTIGWVIWSGGSEVPVLYICNTGVSSGVPFVKRKHFLLKRIYI